MLQLRVKGTIDGEITFDDDEIAKLGRALGIATAVTPIDVERQELTGTAADRYMDVEFPERWTVVETREGETYYWPKATEEYSDFTVYEGRTGRGTIRLAIGRCQRVEVWGRNRPYLITFHITAGGKRPLCEFVATDDFSSTRELVAIIRGTGDSQRGMYGPGAHLPGAYRNLRVEIVKDRIGFKGAYNKQAIVAAEDDIDTMLNHSLIQAELRFEIRPS
jgi:hypothetical protein